MKRLWVLSQATCKVGGKSLGLVLLLVDSNQDSMGNSMHEKVGEAREKIGGQGQNEEGYATMDSISCDLSHV